jgi:hypothetical protein
LAPAVAATLASVLAISVVAGALTTGLLVDRIWAPIVGCIFTLLPVAGCAVLLAPHPGLVTLGVAIALIGLAQGAEIDVVAYMVARYFGMGAYSAIYGMIVMLITLMSSAAGVLFGAAFDRSGSYDLAIVGAGAVFALGAVTYLLMGRYPPHPGLGGATK